MVTEKSSPVASKMASHQNNRDMSDVSKRMNSSINSGNLSFYMLSLVILFICLLTQIVFEPWFRHGHSKLKSLFSLQTATSQNRSQPLASSVWCEADTDGHNTCSFKNLCYAPLERQFIFILSQESVVSGIESKAELQKLELSSVSHHNQFRMKLAIVYSNDSILERNIVYEPNVFLLWRFKWDNIMHVIHDDLLPLFVTYSHLCAGDVTKCASSFRLAFVEDSVDNSRMKEWYRVFSSSEPFLLNNARKDSIVCFDHARAGLLLTSVWFQYGFAVPQGPTNNTRLHGSVVRDFSRYMANRLNVKISSKNVSIAVFFSRRISRKILNENFVLEAIQRAYHDVNPDLPKLEIFTMDMSVNDTKTILSQLLNAKLLIGMHGAELILSVFLPPGSAVVELFPYGITPAYVSPIHALSKIREIEFVYESWENIDESASVTHEDAPLLIGGINHLPESEQSRIKRLVSIPAVKCCHDPAYLFRMFQDTRIGPDISPKLVQALSQQKKLLEVSWQQKYSWWFPASVSNISCNFHHSLLVIQWSAPVNLESNLVLYNITITGHNLHLELTSEKSYITINIIESDYNQGVSIWIKSVALINNEESTDEYKHC